MKTEKQKNNKNSFPSSKKVLLLWGLLLLSVCGLVFAGWNLFAVHFPKEPLDVSQYEKILNKDEIDAWKNNEIKQGQAYLQLNTQIPVEKDNKTAKIRLLNPPYSEFSLKVQVELKERENKLLYESALLKPGTILEQVTLLQELKKGKYDAVVHYTFFDSANKKQGEYSVNVTFVNTKETS